MGIGRFLQRISPTYGATTGRYRGVIQAKGPVYYAFPYRRADKNKNKNKNKNDSPVMAVR
jgi:hypothetical protein